MDRIILFSEVGKLKNWDSYLGLGVCRLKSSDFLFI